MLMRFFALATLLPTCECYSVGAARATASVRRVHSPVLCAADNRIAAADKFFSTLDIDGDGTLSFSELSVHMKALGYASGAIDHVFDLLDVNRDGEIEPSELRETFLKLDDAGLLQALGLGESESDAVFNAIDANGDGEITRQELTSYLLKQGHSSATADSVFATLDENADGAVSRDELHEGYSTYSALRTLLKVDAAPAVVEDVPYTEEALTKLTVVQLKEMLRAAGLRVSGRKAELVERLCDHASAAGVKEAQVA